MGEAAAVTRELRMQCAPKKYKDFLQVKTATPYKSISRTPDSYLN
jgi:hypothetical protein